MRSSANYRTIVTIATAITAAAFLGAAPVAAQPQPQGSIVVMGFGGLFQDNYTAFVIEPFMKKHPGVKVEFRPIRNSGEGFALLQVQKARPTVNVAVMDIAIAIQGNKAGIFEPLDPAQVPNLADLPGWAKPAGNFGPALSQDYLSILYNTKQITTRVTSWKELQNPALKGKIGMDIADTRGVVLIPVLARMAGTDYKTNIDPAIEFLKGVAPSVQTWQTLPEPYTAVQSGQVALAVGWNGRGQFTADQTKDIVAVSIPSEGSVAQINTINLVANSANNAASQAFINYALSVEAQTAFAEKSYYGPTNSKVKLSPDVEKRIFGEGETKQRLMQLDWTWIAERYGPWVERIKREVIGAGAK